MSDADIIAAALAAGWSYQAVALYDEEAVEGWLWTGPAGQELTTLEGDVPETIRLLFDHEARKAAEQRKAEVKEFAEFVEGLMTKGSEQQQAKAKLRVKVKRAIRAIMDCTVKFEGDTFVVGVSNHPGAAADREKVDKTLTDLGCKIVPDTILGPCIYFTRWSLPK
jgi:hypothetical protein